MTTEQAEYMSMREAREYLHIRHDKLQQFVEEGLLTVVTDIFNRRVKLIPRAQVEELAKQRKSRPSSPKNNPRAA